MLVLFRQAGIRPVGDDADRAGSGVGEKPAGRVVGFDRLVDIDDQVENQLETTISTQEPAEDDVRSDDSGG